LFPPFISLNSKVIGIRHLTRMSSLLANPLILTRLIEIRVERNQRVFNESHGASMESRLNGQTRARSFGDTQLLSLEIASSELAEPADAEKTSLRE